jgi:hypothetical protein
MKEKRGQFYIIIAVIIIAVIAGLLSVSNYLSVTRKPVKFYDLSEELGIESEKVVTYGVYKSTNVENFIENFTDTYSDYFNSMTGKSELIFVFGNETNLSMIVYSNITRGRVSLGMGDSYSFIDIEGKDKNKTYFSPIFLPNRGNYVLVNVTGRQYSFTLNRGENFFFVISKSIGNETYVTKT